MNISKCPLCGKMFDQRGFVKACPSCTEQLREDAKTAQAYLEGCPSASFAEIARNTGIDIERLWILNRQGWIHVCLD